MVLPVIGDIPGVPVLMGLLVLVVAAELLFGRHRELTTIIDTTPSFGMVIRV